jgi:C1A family cysteine protease
MLRSFTLACVQVAIMEKCWALPQSIDWRGKGVVGPVQDMGQCPVPWAFAAAGAIQSAAAIKRGELTLLSVQVRTASVR